MKKLRILEANELGHGILVEMDAGYISPKDKLNADILKEAANLDYKNPFEFYAVLQKYDTPNRNGRFYPERILIDLDRVSHIITEIWWEGNILMGKLKLLTSPGFHETGVVSTKGDIAANLMRQGVTLGISSRGVGSLKKVGERNEVQDDFELICFDLVSSPSTPGAYLFSNPEDRNKYEENLDEEKKRKEPNQFVDKSVDLMKKLNDFLGK